MINEGGDQICMCIRGLEFASGSDSVCQEPSRCGNCAGDNRECSQETGCVCKMGFMENGSVCVGKLLELL